MTCPVFECVDGCHDTLIKHSELVYLCLMCSDDSSMGQVGSFHQSVIQ